MNDTSEVLAECNAYRDALSELVDAMTNAYGWQGSRDALAVRAVYEAWCAGRSVLDANR